MSLRFDRIDNFWYVLMHELGHVSQGDKALALDSEMEFRVADSEKPPREHLADEFAAQHLVAPQELSKFIARVRPLYSARQIEGFAKRLQVHPGIVVGQLQYRREVGWNSFRKLLIPIRQQVTSSALTDGWGAVVAALL